MRVVVNLDPLWRCLQIKGFGKSRQQPVLRGTFGHLAGQAFARIPGGILHQFRLLTAPGHGQFHLAPGAVGQKLGHQIFVLHGVRQQDQSGRVLVIVELGQKGFKDFGLFRAGTGARIEVAVAPALVGADEENLDAGLPAFQMQRNDVCL